MGIKNLNRFLLDNCSKKSIIKTHLKQFANKTIVIDTSIYLYRFMNDGVLLENMYLLISIFKSYHITPIFVFDGKPPVEKRELLYQRRVEKKTAEESFNALQNEIDTGVFVTAANKIAALQQMDILKRQFVRIRDTDIRKVKDLMDAYGVVYFDSFGEADNLCAFFVKTGKAWACMSDDMDMFLYGCPVVIRQLSLLNHTISLYNTESILVDLQMTKQDFCEIMVLSGTDYNIHEDTSLIETIRWYNDYNRYRTAFVGNNYLRFYIWLLKNTKYIKDYRSLLETYKIFQLDNYIELEQWRNIDVVEKLVNMKDLKKIMEGEGFIFAG